MFPEIPANLPADLAAARSLLREARLAAAAALRSDDADTRAAAREYAEGDIARLAAWTDDLAAAAALTLEAGDEPVADAEPEVVTEPEAPAVEPSQDLAVVPTFGTETPETPAAPSRKRITPSILVATDAVPGMSAGDSFDDWGNVAVALQERATAIRGNSDVKHTVAKVLGRFPAERQLHENLALNLAKFDDEELTAAMCAPLPPIYDLACMTTTRRPVYNSLPQFQTPTRGGFSIYPSPTLDDITTGYGQWTHVDDANANAVKEACQTIECATPEEYRIYGVYRCITIKNLLQMTYPELVEAYLNRLHSAQSRLAETLLLEAMANGCDTINAWELGQSSGYNATTSIMSTILQYLLVYQEQQRWDVTGLMQAWLPRWVQKAIQIDLVRRRRTDGGRNMVVSLAEIDSMFRDAGVEPHWFIDRPSWATTIPPVATNNVLNRPPVDVQILVAPPGKFALMDRGELSIGVTGNNIYRDNTSNSRNEFTMFFESFEGVINTNTCPAHIIDIPDLCYNGVQIADVVVNCEGADEVGAAS